MLQKEIRLGAAHLFNGMALLFERGCKLPVAGLTFLHALDQRRKPIRRLEQFAFALAQDSAGQIDFTGSGQFIGQKARDGLGALGFHRLVGGAQRVVLYLTGVGISPVKISGASW